MTQSAKSEAADFFGDEEYKVNVWSKTQDCGEIMAQGTPFRPEERNIVLSVDSYIFPVSTVTSEARRKVANNDELAEVEYSFFVKHKCEFNSSAIWVIDDAHAKGWYVESYRIETAVIDDKGERVPKNWAHLSEYVPQTSEQVTNHSSSVSKSFSANVGFMGEAAMGGGSGSFDFSSSTSFSVNDVTIVSNSNNDKTYDGLDVRLNIKPCTAGDERVGLANLIYPGDVSHEAYSPEFIEVWTMTMPPPIDKTFRLKVNLTVNIQFVWDEHGDTLFNDDLIHTLQHEYDFSWLVEQDYPEPPAGYDALLPK